MNSESPEGRDVRPTAGKRPVRGTFLAALALVALIGLVHGRTLSDEWSWAFDDFRFIVKNPFVTNPTSWTAFFTDMRTTDPASPSGIVRPLRTLEFALDEHLFGREPSLFRLHSLLWFAAGATFALLLLRDLLGSVRAAFVGAAVWALHPMQTEAADFISSRGDVASGALVFASVWAALRSRGRDAGFFASLVLAALAMLYKDSGVVVPALVLLVRTMRARGTGLPFRSVLVGTLPWFGVAAAYLVYRQIVAIGPTAHVTTYALGGSTLGTWATMSRAFGAYLGFALVPVRPTVDWYLPASTGFTDVSAAAWFVAHVAILAFAVRALARGSLRGMAVVWFYVALAPVANWPFFLGIPTTERFLHVPLLALGIGAAFVFRGARRRSAAGAWGAAGLAVAALGVASFVRTADWRNDATLWAASARVTETPRGEGYLCAEVRREAVAALLHAREVAPGPERERAEAEANHLLERALEHAHNALAAWARIEGTWRSDSYAVCEPHSNASNLCGMLRRYGEALYHAEEAIRIQEDRGFQQHYNRALALLGLGRGAAAVRSTGRALELGFIPSDDERNMFLEASKLCEADGETALARAALEAALHVRAPGTEVFRARLGDLESRVRIRIAVLREAVVSVPLGEARVQPSAALAVALAADGSVREAEEVAGTVGGEAEVLRAAGLAWIHARWAARGTPEGWRAALERLAPSGRTGPPSADFWFLRGRCAEELLETDAALEAFREFLRLGEADRHDPRVPRAEAAVRRLERPCPEIPISR